MHTREWTGSVAVLPNSLRDLALEFQRKGFDDPKSPLAGYLRDHASTLYEWGDAVDELYARLDAKGSSASVMTNAQGVALAARFTERTLSMSVMRGAAGLPEHYIYVIAKDRDHRVRDFDFGIDTDGRVSS